MLKSGRQPANCSVIQGAAGQSSGSLAKTVQFFALLQQQRCQISFGWHTIYAQPSGRSIFVSFAKPGNLVATAINMKFRQTRLNEPYYFTALILLLLYLANHNAYISVH
jgi:hypothetical protein